MISLVTENLIRVMDRPSIAPSRLLRSLLCGWILCCLGPEVHAQFMARAVAVQQGWFESWALQGKSEAYFRDYVKSQAQLEIENLKAVVTITERQEAKLILALEGDLSRFFRMVDEARFKTRNMQPVNEQVGEISRIISPIQQKVQKGILDDSSLFHSVLESMLSPEQSDLWKEENARRQRLINKAIVQVQITNLEKSMPLLQKQREALINSILDRLEGKRVIDQYRVYLVDYAMYTVPESKLKQILDEGQVKFYLRKKSEVEGWKSMLEGQGAKFEEEPDPEDGKSNSPDEDEAGDGAEKEKVKKAPVQRNAGGLG